MYLMVRVRDVVGIQSHRDSATRRGTVPEMFKSVDVRFLVV
jgi:hypothetical protein